jgi:hypothetical protein
MCNPLLFCSGLWSLLNVKWSVRDCNQLAKIDLFHWNSSKTLVGNYIYIAPRSMKMQAVDFFLKQGKSKGAPFFFFICIWLVIYSQINGLWNWNRGSTLHLILIFGEGGRLEDWRILFFLRIWRPHLPLILGFSLQGRLALTATSLWTIWYNTPSTDHKIYGDAGYNFIFGVIGEWSKEEPDGEIKLC